MADEVSPVLSGAYKNAYEIFLNGKPVVDVSEYRAGDDLMITNLLPYSRKIEVGSMKMRVAGTSKVYQQARRIVMNRFGNSVSFEFTYRANISGRTVDQAKTATKKRKEAAEASRPPSRLASNALSVPRDQGTVIASYAGAEIATRERLGTRIASSKTAAFSRRSCRVEGGEDG